MVYPSRTMSDFIEVEVDEGDGIDEAVQLRFKAVTPPRSVRRARFDRGQGLSWWTIEGLAEEPRAALVEDSSDGEALLIFGGPRGLRITRASTGETRREPYLLLARGSEVELPGGGPGGEATGEAASRVVAVPGAGAPGALAVALDPAEQRLGGRGVRQALQAVQDGLPVRVDLRVQQAEERGRSFLVGSPGQQPDQVTIGRISPVKLGLQGGGGENRVPWVRRQPREQVAGKGRQRGVPEELPQHRTPGGVEALRVQVRQDHLGPEDTARRLEGLRREVRA
jgi:hypothetical protein